MQIIKSYNIVDKTVYIIKRIGLSLKVKLISGIKGDKHVTPQGESYFHSF